MTTPEQVSQAADLVRETCDLTGIPQEQVHQLVDAAEAAIVAMDGRADAFRAYAEAEEWVQIASGQFWKLRTELGLGAKVPEVVR